MKLHHAQISMPRGHEDEARRFYRDVLGLDEVDKPLHVRDGFGNRVEVMTPAK